MNSYLTIIFGSGYAGLGFAAAQPETLILEETETVGSDFHAVLRPAYKVSTPHTKQAQELCEFLRHYNVMTEGEKLDVLRLSTAICRYEELRNTEILLNARLISIIYEPDGYYVNIATNSGVRTLHTKQIIDVTAKRVTARNSVRVCANQLHIICSNPTDDFEERIHKFAHTAKCRQLFMQGEWSVTFDFAPEITLAEARLKTEQLWQRAFPNGESLIDAVSFDFDVVAKPVGTEKIPWIAPHAYDDPIAAYDAGVLFATTKEVQK